MKYSVCEGPTVLQFKFLNTLNISIICILSALSTLLVDTKLYKTLILLLLLIQSIQ